MRGTHLWFPRGQSPDERVTDPATVLHETELTDPGVVSDDDCLSTAQEASFGADG